MTSKKQKGIMAVVHVIWLSYPLNLKLSFLRKCYARFLYYFMSTMSIWPVFKCNFETQFSSYWPDLIISCRILIPVAAISSLQYLDGNKHLIHYAVFCVWIELKTVPWNRSSKMDNIVSRVMRTIQAECHDNFIYCSIPFDRYKEFIRSLS